MNWLLSGILSAVLVEAALRMPFGPALKSLHHSTRKAGRTVRAKNVSDHWKEKAMAGYARTTFAGSLRLAVYLALLLGLAAVFVWALDLAFGGLFAFMISWQGIVSTIVFASFYLMLRKQFVHG